MVFVAASRQVPRGRGGTVDFRGSHSQSLSHSATACVHRPAPYERGLRGTTCNCARSLAGTVPT